MEFAAKVFLIVHILIQLAYCEDLKSQYLRCLIDEKTKSTPKEVFIKCLEQDVTHDSSHDILDHCKARYDLSIQCIQTLMNVDGFKDCIGEENRKNLQVVIDIAIAEKNIDCSVTMQELNESRICTAENYQNFGACLPQTLGHYPTPSILESMAGFKYDKEYCEKWQKFKQCHMDAVKSCTSVAIKYFDSIHEARYAATPCASDAYSLENSKTILIWISSLAALMQYFKKSY